MRMNVKVSEEVIHSEQLPTKLVMFWRKEIWKTPRTGKRDSNWWMWTKQTPSIRTVVMAINYLCPPFWEIDLCMYLHTICSHYRECSSYNSYRLVLACPKRYCSGFRSYQSPWSSHGLEQNRAYWFIYFYFLPRNCSNQRPKHNSRKNLKRLISVCRELQVPWVTGIHA